MKTIAVRIKEVDKGGRQLTLQNLREEVVGVMYRDTVARSTRADMQFYILLFFAAVPSGSITALEAILDDGIPKFEALTRDFQRKRGYLQANEYHEKVVQHGLTELFYKDLFFVITDGVQNIADIELKYSDVLADDPALTALFERLKENYLPRLRGIFESFQASKIQDDRIDDDGNYHDLSKSVYRTVLMRSSRNLELNLQKYTAVKKIESNSPVDLTFLQHIDPNVVVDLWNKYHVAHYMGKIVKTGWSLANDQLPATAIGSFIGSYLTYKRLNGRENPKEKRHAKATFEDETRQHTEYLEKLNTRLIDSVLESNVRLREDIKELKRERLDEAQKAAVLRDENSIKSLNERIERLENLQVSTNIKAQDDESQTILI